jgi:alkylation response protein AidB-like acyl-CoA dehydrogenase
LGLFGLGLPEGAGEGYGLAEEVLAARSLGRRCVSPSVIATMLAVHAAAASGDAGLERALRGGEARAAFVNPLEDSEAHLIDAAGCDVLLLLTSPLAVLPLEHVRARHPVASLDDSLGLERARIAPGAGIPAPELAGRGSLLLAAYLAGIAQATLAMATAHALTREQFGQPIGAFQAIKHSCADMAVRAAGAEAQSFYAAVAWGASGTDSAVDIACARWLSREAAIANAKANIQIHGAMGFTAECDAHWYLKRALAVAHLGSDSRSEERQILVH